MYSFLLVVCFLMTICILPLQAKIRHVILNQDQIVNVRTAPGLATIVQESIGRIKGVFYEIKKYLMYSSLFSLTFLFLESPFRCHSDEILGWDLLKFSIF